jgi:hypothetical protein
MPINWRQPQPPPRTLWSVVHANFPVTRFTGTYNRRNIAGTSTPSAHAEGRALDIGLLVSRPAEKALGEQLFKLFIRDAAELGLDHVIWNTQIWSARRGGPRHYGGANPHTDHIHMAWTRDGSQRVVFPRFILDISILRMGLEELAQASRNIA